MKKKIGVFGTLNSGKTVLLTSLLWHLKEFSAAKFKIGGQKEAEIKDFELIEKDTRSFNYNAYVSKFIEVTKWFTDGRIWVIEVVIELAKFLSVEAN